MMLSRSLALFQKVRWRLTLSYLFVTLAAIFMLAWWGLAAAVIYLGRSNPDLTWLQVLQYRVLPVLVRVIPSALLLAIPASLLSVYFGFLTARWFDLRLVNLRQATQAWQRGDFSVKTSDPTGDEIGAFGNELNAMADDLQRLLHARADLAVLEERTQLSRDLHDSVKQHITAAAFQISSAHALLEANPAAARASIEEAENLVHTAHQELNTIIFELRPLAIKARTLGQALGEYAAGWSRQNPIRAVVEIQEDIALPAALQQEVMRFVQEALSNVARHSGASNLRIAIRISKMSSDQSQKNLHITILDDGTGFQPEAVGEGGYGLRSMRERIARLGGDFSVESQPGQGTRLNASIPIPDHR